MNFVHACVILVDFRYWTRAKFSNNGQVQELTYLERKFPIAIHESSTILFMQITQHKTIWFSVNTPKTYSWGIDLSMEQLLD